MRISILLSLAIIAASGVAPAGAVNAAARRGLDSEDYYRLVDVSDPQMAPDGSAAAYVVTVNDRSTDAPISSVWLVDWDGTERRALTGTESASRPRFSPDGRYVSFLSAHAGESSPQVWLLDLHGGEARQVTHSDGEITDYAWAPDGKRLVLTVGRADAEGKTPKPIVIDRFHFKQDERGYLTADSHRHLALVDVANGAQSPLTPAAAYDDGNAAWAPDGSRIAYVSNHQPDAERSGADEIYVIEPREGAEPRRIATVYSPNGQRLVFSPDGLSLAVLQGREPKLNAYISDRLALIDVASGALRPLTDALDRQVSAPAFGADGASISFVVEDRGSTYLARLALAGGGIERAGGETLTVLGQSAAAGHTVLLASTDAQPPELYALGAGGVRPLTAHNAAVLAQLDLGAVQDIHFKSRDGTDIQGQLIKPPDYLPGRRYPAILWIHGGPAGQDQHELIPEGYSPSLERELFAAHGYLVLAVNYRGSSGRGRRFQESIAADWGHKEVEDLLAAADYAVAQGLADPARLGVGGWSYGGILTDYTIASDPRFKAAISGAGSGDQIGIYGLDQYPLQWHAEIGPPWRNAARYLRISYPFFKADRIRTPTLFMGGEKDFNVPIAGGEQMYMALRALGIPTELVIYPGEYHVFTRPSFLKDRADRYLAWFDKYLRATP